jgi:hypothetical protein
LRAQRHPPRVVGGEDEFGRFYRRGDHNHVSLALPADIPAVPSGPGRRPRGPGDCPGAGAGGAPGPGQGVAGATGRPGWEGLVPVVEDVRGQGEQAADSKHPDAHPE